LDLQPDDALPAGEVMIPGGRRDEAVAQSAPQASSEQEVAQADAATSSNTVSALGDMQALPTPPAAPVKPKPAVIEYEVQDGDSLRSLALMFGVDVPTLLQANNLDDPDNVPIGTKLRVLPVAGVEYTVRDGETLADIARGFEVDGGAIADANGVSDPNLLHVGQTLVIPGAKTARPAPRQSEAEEDATSDAGDSSSEGSGDVVQEPSDSDATASDSDAEPEEVAAAPPHVSGGGSAVVENAMAHLGQAYVWGGIGPRGFDCSGFVYYVHNVSGLPVSRGLWGQLNGGPRISIDELEPGDTVFFANTYQPGLSHAGIYIGGGQFIHASDPSTGVTISSIGSGYWSSRYIGASRLW
jgi:peptidoglycan endopeptidase LytE